MAPLLSSDILVTRLSCSIHLYCRPAPPPPESPGPRPLLLLWLGAQPAPRPSTCSSAWLVALMCWLWRVRRALGQAAHLLALLRGSGALAGRPLMVHVLSLGGYTFAQMLLLMSQDPRCHNSMAQRLRGHIFNSLVVGSLDRIALGVSQLMRPQALGPVVRATALLYFHLCQPCTVRHYEAAVGAFWQPLVRPPTLVFHNHDHPLCDSARLHELLAGWWQLAMPVWAQAWETSHHTAHLCQHPWEYRGTLTAFLGGLGLVALVARGSGLPLITGMGASCPVDSGQ